MARTLAAVTAVFFLAGLVLVAWAGVEVKADEKNVVALKLAGKWVPDPGLSKRLGASEKERENPIIKSIEFIMDDTVAAKVPDRYDEFLKDMQVYAAGNLKMLDKSFPFILISLGGCPHVVFFRERDGDPMGDAESFYVMLAGARDKSKDLLFVGGDFPGEPFVACQRAPEKDK